MPGSVEPPGVGVEEEQVLTGQGERSETNHNQKGGGINKNRPETYLSQELEEKDTPKAESGDRGQ